MPQLETAPWLWLMICTWAVLLTIIHLKVNKFAFTKDPSALHSSAVLSSADFTTFILKKTTLPWS